MDNPITQKDLQFLAQIPVLEELASGSRVLITGATGLIGSLAAKALLLHSRKTGKELHLLLQVRNEEKARALFGCGEAFQLLTGDIAHPLPVHGPIDYILHCASPTDSRFFLTQPVQTIETALTGTRNMLELARQTHAKKLVFLSSLEIYGTPDKALVSETDGGTLDPMNPRSSYSEGKRMAECLCAAYHAQYGVNAVVARLTQIMGPDTPYTDGKVFAQFARCAIEGRDILLHSQGRTLRRYCYSADTVSALFCLLLRGVPGQAYNVATPDTGITVKELAELVCNMVPEKGIRVRVEIPENIASLGYNPERAVELDSRKLLALGWAPTVGIEEMLKRTITGMAAGRNITIEV